MGRVQASPPPPSSPRPPMVMLVVGGRWWRVRGVASSAGVDIGDDEGGRERQRPSERGGVVNNALLPAASSMRER